MNLTLLVAQTDFKMSGLNSQRLKGKIAVLTGSTDGIGLATARRLAQEGAIVVVSSRKLKNVEAAVETLKKEGHDVRGVVCHVGHKEERARLVEKSVAINGKIDIFVSAAGVNPANNLKNSLTASAEEWDKTFDINVTAAFLLTKEILPYMARGGAIVYLSSISGIAIYSTALTYGISKSMLIALSRAVAYQCIPLGIRVNCVSPGAVKSAFTQIYMKDSSMNSAVHKFIPMHRYGEASEIASLIAFLCSDEASYITGENHVIAGGIHSRL